MFTSRIVLIACVVSLWMLAIAEPTFAQSRTECRTYDNGIGVTTRCTFYPDLLAPYREPLQAPAAPSFDHPYPSLPVYRPYVPAPLWPLLPSTVTCRTTDLGGLITTRCY